MNYYLTFLTFVLLYPINILGFTHLSPFSYCNADPINYIDPTGEDVVVLNYGYDAVHQHLAMLIQDENGKWQYYSINGNNVFISGKHYGGREFNDIAVGSWDSPDDFFQSDYNTSSTDSKDDVSKNHFGYHEGYQLKTTDDQDALMRNSFIEKAKTVYSILGNNCATAVQSVLFEAGIPIAEPALETIRIPANKYFGEPESIITRPNINPYPSSAFKSIIKMNPNGIYIQK